jgi:hypothetical protein
MSYLSRIRDIQSAFIMGFEDRDACITMFESLLHEYGLLPASEQLDRAITNESFLALLKAAREHKGTGEPQPGAGTDDLRQAQESIRRFTEWMERMADKRYRIADSVNRVCPVCQRPTTTLFNRVQNRDHETIGVDPPRCQPCMTKWVQERYGVPAGGEDAPKPSTADGSPVSPLRTDEADFFAEYERQMGES